MYGIERANIARFADRASLDHAVDRVCDGTFIGWCRDTGPLAVSVVSISEVAGGMRSPERRQVSRLLSSVRTFPVTERIAWRAAELMRAYRRSHPGIGLGDYLIAATAEVEGLDLATLNLHHFPMVEGLEAPFRL